MPEEIKKEEVEKVVEPVVEEVKEAKVDTKQVKEVLDAVTNRDEMAALRTELKTVVSSINDLKTGKPGETVDSAMTARLDSIETALGTISSKINQDTKFETISEILDDHPELLNKETGLPFFSIKGTDTEMREDSERVLAAGQQIASRQLGEYESVYGGITRLTQPIDREELKRQEDEDVKTAREGGPDAGNAAGRLFQNRLNKVLFG